MRFVFKEEQPVFRFAVYVYLDFHGAGVDFLGFVQIFQLPGVFQIPCADGRQIHQILGLRAPQFLADCHIAVVSFLNRRVVNFHAVNRRQKRGVAAVVGPVGINHADFRNGRVAVFAFEIILAESDVRVVHRKCIFLHKIGKLRFGKRSETVERFDFGGDVVRHVQRFDAVERSFAAFHGVDDIFFNRVQLRGRNLAENHIDFRGAHQRLFALRNELNALRAGIRTLVELTGQVFCCEYNGVGLRQVGVSVVELRLGKHGLFTFFEQRFVNVFHVVAVEKTKVGNRVNHQKRTNVGKERSRLVREFLFLFYINSVNHVALLICVPRVRADRCLCGKMRRQSGFLRPPHRLFAAQFPNLCRLPLRRAHARRT